MLAYLYTGIVPLLGLPVSFLVRIEQELPDQPNSFNGEDSPAKWRQRSFDRRPGQVDWNGIQSCCPHALYRLSDLYSLTDLRQRCLDYIRNSLHCWNVSPFSLSLPPMTSTRDAGDLTLFVCRLRMSSSVLSRSITRPFERRFFPMSSTIGCVIVSDTDTALASDTDLRSCLSGRCKRHERIRDSD